MKEELLSLKNNALSLNHWNNRLSRAWKKFRLQFLGKNGNSPSFLRLANSCTGKPTWGRTISQWSQANHRRHHKNKKQMKSASTKQQNLSISMSPNGNQTFPWTPPSCTQAVREITKIFERIGFSRVRYPEVEWDWYAFTSLNFPDNHPARDDWETFWLAKLFLHLAYLSSWSMWCEKTTGPFFDPVLVIKMFPSRHEPVVVRKVEWG